MFRLFCDASKNPSACQPSRSSLTDGSRCGFYQSNGWRQKYPTWKEKKKSENQKKPQSIIRSSLRSEIVSYHRGGELKSLTDEQQMN